MKQINLKLIARRRNELDITLQKMALILGFKNASTYMKYEKGEYVFKANHLPVIANTLNCNIDDLFFEENFAKTANNNQVVVEEAS